MVPQELVHLVETGFALDLDGVHGAAHWARVRTNGLRLAELTGANQQVIELFAWLHDSQRLNDVRDPQHGARAAEFAESLRGSVLTLSDEEFEWLYYACSHHTRGLKEADVTVQTCCDADRLDLGRIGIRPDPRRLCTDAAREPAMIEWAYRQSRTWR